MRIVPNRPATLGIMGEPTQPASLLQLRVLGIAGAEVSLRDLLTRITHRDRRVRIEQLLAVDLVVGNRPRPPRAIPASCWPVSFGGPD
jgi:hypothetical protein